MLKSGAKVIGPLSSRDLQARCSAGEISPVDLVKQQGQTEWQAASSIRGLFPVGYSQNQAEEAEVVDVEKNLQPSPPAFQQKNDVIQSKAKWKSRLVLIGTVVLLLSLIFIATLLSRFPKGQDVEKMEKLHAESNDLIEIDKDFTVADENASEPGRQGNNSQDKDMADSVVLPTETVTPQTLEAEATNSGSIE